MIKQLIISLMLASVLVFAGCTSKKSDTADGEAVTAEEDALFNEEGGEEEVAEGDEEDLEGDDEEFGDEEGEEDVALEDDEAEEGTEEEEEDVVADLGSDEAEEGAEGEEGAEEFAEGEETSGEEGELVAEDDSTFEEPLTEEDSGDGFADTEEEVAPAKTWVPVKKIASEPFNKNGYLVNAVYIARPGDSVETVSQKIFGNPDQASDILTVNPNLGRGLKTGDKVYYNSPSRAEDGSRLLTYYEDIGLQPETYISQDGDNIRQVSKELLGDDRSWMEVWATNFDVDSKGEIPGGLSLRYWSGTGDATPAAPVASNNPDDILADDLGGDIPPPPPADLASNDLPPPPPPADLANNDLPPPPPPANDLPSPDSPVASNDLPPPPPPPSASNDLPPPPPPPSAATTKRKKFGSKVGKAKSGQDETLMLAAGAALLLAAVGLIVMMRKRRAKRALADFANSQTQTETRID